MRTHARHGIAATLVAISTAALPLFGTTPAQAALPTPVSASTARSYLASLTVSAEPLPYRLQPRPVPPLDHHQRHLQHPRDRPQARRLQRGHRLLLRRHERQLVLPLRRSHLVRRLRRRHRPPHPPRRSLGLRRLQLDHTSKRQALANDLTRPQLLAVTDNVNQSKGDRDPGTWWPSRTTYRCTYARAWVQVKYYYGLSVDSAEKSALSSVLNGC